MKMVFLRARDIRFKGKRHRENSSICFSLRISYFSVMVWGGSCMCADRSVCGLQTKGKSYHRNCHFYISPLQGDWSVNHTEPKMTHLPDSQCRDWSVCGHQYRNCKSKVRANTETTIVYITATGMLLLLKIWNSNKRQIMFQDVVSQYFNEQ